MNFLASFSAFFVSAILFALAPSVAQPEKPSHAHVQPDLSTDEAKLRYLLYIKQHIPNLFDDSMEYEINLFELLEHQKEMEKNLSAVPSYKKAVSERPPLVTLTIQTGSAKGVSESEQSFAKDQLEAFKKPLIETLEGIAEGQSIAEYETELLKAAKDPGTAPLMGALMRVLPPEKKEGLKNLDYDGKVAYLREHLGLPDGTLPASFRASQFGISPPVTVEKVTAMLGTGAQADLHAEKQKKASRALENLKEIKTFSLLQDSKTSFESPAASAVVREQITGLSKGAVQDVLSSPKLEKNLRDRIEARVGQAAAGVSEGAANSGVTKKSNTLRLIEVPATVGIFRGCTGGDCSSKYSFPYPNDPNEKVFFVMDEKSKVKGYVAATVMAGQKKENVLYVHTIAGSRISSDDTRAILAGLNEEKKTFGAAGVVIPTVSQTKGLINYAPIRKVYSELHGNPEQVEITHHDESTREAIEKFEGNNSGSYDHQNKNKKGYRLREEPLRKSLGAIQVSIEKSDRKWADPPAAMNKEESIAFAFQLSLQGRNSEVKRVLGALNVEEKRFKEFSKALENNKGLGLTEHQKEVKKQLQNLSGITASSETLLDRLSLPGMRNCSDLFSPENLSETQRLMKTGLKAGGRDAYHIACVLTAQKEWTQEVWKEVPRVLKTGGDGLEKIARALKAQENWPPVFWKEVPGVLKAGGDVAEGIAWALKPKEKWPPGFWEEVPGVLKAGGDGAEGIAWALQGQKEWPPEVWKEVPGVLKAGGVGAKRIARALKPQEKWPPEVWKEVPGVLKAGGDGAVIISEALKAQKEWPPEFCKEVTGVLKAGGDGAARISEALKAQEKWNPEVWKEVPGVLKAGGDGAERIAWALQGQKEWPPEVWKEVTGVLKAGGLGAERIALALQGQKEWPPEVWKEVPGVLKAGGNGAARISEALKAQKEWPPGFWREAPSVLKTAVTGLEPFVEALKTQKEWPPEFWREMPKILKARTWRVSHITVALKAQEKWPPEVWKEVPGVLKAGGDGAVIISEALKAQEKWPPEFWQALREMKTKYPNVWLDVQREFQSQPDWESKLNQVVNEGRMNEFLDQICK
ncbi:MAG: hypothetical protein KGP28_07755 [Bdellovibrionales bacterium]|nr:hypothetical protein [Bdellovibrionales bacterium]